jgi:hypothetical protein
MTFTTSDDYIQAYPLVKSQNNALLNTIQSKKELYSTDNQQFLYKNQKYNTYVSVNYYLFILYVCIIFFLIVFLVMTDKLTMTPKILFILFFMVYPFTVFYVENYLYMIGLYMYSVINGVSYEKNQ